MADGSVIRIMSYVSAKSPQGLRRAMLANSIKKQVWFAYQDISFSGGKWYAWFQEIVSTSTLDLKLENGNAPLESKE